MQKNYGHYYCNALYDTCSDAETIRKKEYRAKKWAFLTLVPYKVLLSLKEKGYTSIYDMAEQLEVSEELVNTAFAYYKANNYI